MGKVDYLNTAPFFEFLDKKDYKVFPAPPRQLGKLFKDDNLTTGIISLADYLEKIDSYEMLDFGIVGNQKVKSVLLFSKYPIEELNEKSIAVTDETSTSSRLLQVILEQKYNLDVTYINESINSHSELLSNYDAFLTIGDDALKFRKLQLEEFKYQYDLAELWYEWKQLPFVFAVWVIKKSLPHNEKIRFNEMLKNAYELGMENINELGQYRGRSLDLNKDETQEYLSNLNYTIGEKEKEAIAEFYTLLKHNIKVKTYT
ncbi:MAG: menaquinone biosynthesis protein [Ignavibacteria bacterium]|nr:menaquinone biosynthesis protein [Ignavibacteria bacterium]